MYFKLIEGCINKLLEYSIYYGHTSVMVQLKNNTCKAEIKSDTSESLKKKSNDDSNQRAGVSYNQIIRT